MHILNEKYENSSPSVWTRRIEYSGSNHAVYEIQLTETTEDVWELRVFSLDFDDAGSEIWRAPIWVQANAHRVPRSPGLLDLVAERHIEQVNARRVQQGNKGRVNGEGK